MTIAIERLGHDAARKIDHTVFSPFLRRFNLDDTYIAGEGMRALLHDNERYPLVEEVIAPHDREWAITAEKARFLARLVIATGARNILEFGAGTSSLVLARALAHVGGGRLTSVEQMPEWCAEPWAQVEQTDDVDARLIESQPVFQINGGTCCYSYASATPEIEARGPYDLVLIDAPPGSYGRDGSLHLAYAALRPGALIALDDAGRSRERWAIYRWLRTYPGLSLKVFAPTFSNTGTAVLSYNGDARTRWSASGALSSVSNVLRHLAGRALRGGRT